jgi:CDP-diglyceride synthetase
VASCPLIAFILLWKNIKKDKKGDNKVKQYLLILYQGLKPTKFYWEFVNTLRKVLLLFILMLSDILKVMFSVLILYSTIRLQLYLKPYQNDEYNKIEILSLISGLVIVLSTLLFTSDESVQFINLCILILIILINTKFILEWLYQVLLSSNSKLKFIQIVSQLEIFLTFYSQGCCSNSSYAKNTITFLNSTTVSFLLNSGQDDDKKNHIIKTKLEEFATLEDKK